MATSSMGHHARRILAWVAKYRAEADRAYASLRDRLPGYDPADDDAPIGDRMFDAIVMLTEALDAGFCECGAAGSIGSPARRVMESACWRCAGLTEVIERLGISDA